MTRSYRMLLAGVLLLAACAESATGPEAGLAPSFKKSGPSRTTTTATQPTLDWPGLIAKLPAIASAAGLMACYPQEKVSVSQVVGPAGGTVTIGKHSLVIPKSALASTVTITAEAVPDSFNSIRFGPDGLKFSQSAVLTMDYYNCLIPLSLSAAYIAYVDENKNILERRVSFDDPQTYRVSAPIDHFSRYAVAW